MAKEIFVGRYETKHGLDSYVFSTHAKALKAMADIAIENVYDIPFKKDAIPVLEAYQAGNYQEAIDAFNRGWEDDCTESIGIDSMDLNAIYKSEKMGVSKYLKDMQGSDRELT